MADRILLLGATFHGDRPVIVINKCFDERHPEARTFFTFCAWARCGDIGVKQVSTDMFWHAHTLVSERDLNSLTRDSYGHRNRLTPAGEFDGVGASS